MISTDVRFFSDVLGMSVSMRCLLPGAGAGPFNVLYLLHGLSDDETAWTRFTRIENGVADRPLAIVMPQGFRGYYTNNVEGPAYHDYLIKDVVRTAQRIFPLRTDRAGRAIAGLSMGGYGALRTALGRADLFCCASSLSGAVTRGHETLTTRPDGLSPGEFTRVFGLAPAGTDHDLLHLAAQRVAEKTLPRLHLECGVDDFLIGHNRSFHAALTTLGVPHRYVEHAGVHDWDYWAAHINETIEFVNDSFDK